MTSGIDRTPEQQVAGVIIPELPGAGKFATIRLEETAGLVEALECECAFVRFENIRAPSPSILFGSGQLERLKGQLEDSGCNMLVVDGDLTPIQQRNLERKLSVKVIDRTALILEIFGIRARSKAGRLQVEFARVEYERSRLVRTWTHLERQRGGVGFISGPGETQLEADRRMLDRVIRKLRKDLADVRRTRAVQRAGREKRETPVVALVGYTNAGKSTLFNRMTNSDVIAKDMPFATLDPTVRETVLDRIGSVAFVDTVGFITDLPTHLIDSFDATLEEAMDADILLHVRDISSVDSLGQKADVEEVLERLEEVSGHDAPPILEVWNKIDVCDPDDQETLRISARSNVEGDAIPVSALTGEGMYELLQAIEYALLRRQTLIRAKILPSDGRAFAWLHENGDVEDLTADDSGNQTVSVRLSDAAFGRFQIEFPKVDFTVETKNGSYSAGDWRAFTERQRVS